jgi:hypothetical protein
VSRNTSHDGKMQQVEGSENGASSRTYVVFLRLCGDSTQSSHAGLGGWGDLFRAVFASCTASNDVCSRVITAPCRLGRDRERTGPLSWIAMDADHPVSSIGSSVVITRAGNTHCSEESED